MVGRLNTCEAVVRWTNQILPLNTLEVQDVVPLSPYVDVLLGSVTP